MPNSNLEYWVSKYKGFTIGFKSKSRDGVSNAQGIQFVDGILVLDQDERQYNRKVKFLHDKARFNVDVFGPFDTLKEAESKARFAGRNPIKVIQSEAGLSPSELSRSQAASEEIAALRSKPKGLDPEAEHTAASGDPDKDEGSGEGNGSGSQE